MKLKTTSMYEILFEEYLKERAIKFDKEYKFDEKRKFRFDFAIPDKKIGIELEGGIFSKGRHTNPIGFSNDCEKYNLASNQGWKIYRIPTHWFKKDFDKLEEILSWLKS